MDQRDAKLHRGHRMLSTAGRRQGLELGRAGETAAEGTKRVRGCCGHVTHKASRSQRPPTNAGLKEETTQPSLGPHTCTASVAGVTNIECFHL